MAEIVIIAKNSGGLSETTDWLKIRYIILHDNFHTEPKL